MSPVWENRISTGTLDMIALSQAAGLKSPDLRQNGGQFAQTLWRPTPEGAPDVKPTPEGAPEVARLLRVEGGPFSRKEMQDQLGLKDDEHFRKAYLLPALAAGFIEMTVPDRPTSRLQKYRITGKGKAWLSQKEQTRKKR